MNKIQTTILTARIGFAIWKIKRGFKRADKQMEKARREEQRAQERSEAARILESRLNIEQDKGGRN